jgi:hypothetical protein
LDNIQKKVSILFSDSSWILVVTIVTYRNPWLAKMGVNVHEKKIPINTWKTKQWNNAFIVVLHLEVTMMPSTMSLDENYEC